MKLYSSDLAKILKFIESDQIRSILLHGPNNGFIKVIIQQIVNKFNLRIVEAHSKDITSQSLELLANSKNFFGQRELIKINLTTSTITKDIKNLFNEMRFENFICFVANESLPPSGIRKFFEDAPTIASVGCYYEDENTISRIILQECAKNTKTIEEEALFYLKNHLKGDNQFIKNELDKLLSYTHDKNVITKVDVTSTLSLSPSQSGDEMCISFAKKQPDRYISEVQSLLSTNINEILIIRALIRYYMNIFIASSKVENGENLDSAIKTLAPPIFFKYVNDFKQIIRSNTSADAVRAISILQSAEIKYKTNSSSFDFMNDVYLPVHHQELL
jgi:DNA polymerase-3 subunit delta